MVLCRMNSVVANLLRHTNLNASQIEQVTMGIEVADVLSLRLVVACSNRHRLVDVSLRTTWLPSATPLHVLMTPDGFVEKITLDMASVEHALCVRL